MADISRDCNTFCSENPHEKAKKDQLGPRGGSSLIHNCVKYLRADVNDGFLLELHEEDSFGIVDCSHLPHWIQVEHHDGGEASHVDWKCYSVETSPLFLSTNVILDSFYR